MQDMRAHELFIEEVKDRASLTPERRKTSVSLKKNTMICPIKSHEEMISS